MQNLLNTWQIAWSTLGARGDGASLLEALINNYSEPHRHYHSLQHLRECLDLFAQVEALTEYPAELILALWFHDAIYDVHRSDNEIKSAQWARTELEQYGVSQEQTQRVHSLILATQHSALPTSPTEQLLVDIDLAILGASQNRFAEYELQIRAEYAYVPGWLFRRKRRGILKGFLDRKTIYSTGYFNARFEKSARENIKRSLGYPPQ